MVPGAVSAARKAPNTSISRDNRNESRHGGCIQAIGPCAVIVGGSVSAPVTSCTLGGHGSMAPYRSPMSTMWCSGESGWASTAGAQRRGSPSAQATSEASLLLGGYFTQIHVH